MFRKFAIYLPGILVLMPIGGQCKPAVARYSDYIALPDFQAECLLEPYQIFIMIIGAALLGVIDGLGRRGLLRSARIDDER